MPYITYERKKDLTLIHLGAVGAHCKHSGELCYCFYKIALDYIKNKRRFINMGEVINALECAKLEFYRRIVSPYEDEKIKENGDVD